jgi:hypothetical protein
MCLIGHYSMGRTGNSAASFTPKIVAGPTVQRTHFAIQRQFPPFAAKLLG